MNDAKMERTAKTLSIVTITRNARAGFLRTADSIYQTKPEWCEWIVIDGASTDGTVESAKSLLPTIDCFVSEPDNGIASAFNKGIKRASGEYIIFVNSGDTLNEGFFEKVQAAFSTPKAPDVVVGRIRMNGRNHGAPVSFRRQCVRNYLPHQAMIIRRSLFRLVGLYDESFRLGMDYEWSLRLKNRWRNIRFVSDVFAEMEPGGTSITNFRRTYAAYHAAREKHCSNRLMSKCFELFFVVKVTIGNLLRRAFRR